MEDGFLGKILVKDGAKDIPVGQVYLISWGNAFHFDVCDQIGYRDKYLKAQFSHSFLSLVVL